MNVFNRCESCCGYIPPAVFIFSETASRFCYAVYGFSPSPDNENSDFTAGSGNCTWTVKNRFNVKSCEFLKYKYFYENQSWINVPICAGSSAISKSHFLTKYEYLPNGDISFDVLAASEGCCPGQSRDRNYLWEEPISDCILPAYSSWAESGSQTAGHYVSKYGDRQTQIKFRFKVAHRPTITCFLQVWFRIKITKFSLKDGENGGTKPLFSGAIYEPIEDSIEYEDIEESYIWKESGTIDSPCLKDKNKSLVDDDNLIDEDDWKEVEATFEKDEQAVNDFQEWSNDLGNTVSDFLNESDYDNPDVETPNYPSPAQITTCPPTLGGAIEKQLQTKYSFIEGYEPPWPDE